MTATTGMLARSARDESWGRSSNHRTGTAPDPTHSHYRYVCLTCSDPDIQILGNGHTCWNCGSTRLAPAGTIANTRPGETATSLLARWRHLIG